MDDSTDAKTRKRTPRTAAEWRAIMARHEASGLAGEAFCEAAGIGRSAFWRWRGRLAKEGRAGREREAGIRRAVHRERSAPAAARFFAYLVGVLLRVGRHPASAHRRTHAAGVEDACSRTIRCVPTSTVPVTRPEASLRPNSLSGSARSRHRA